MHKQKPITLRHVEMALETARECKVCEGERLKIKKLANYRKGKARKSGNGIKMPQPDESRKK